MSSVHMTKLTLKCLHDSNNNSEKAGNCGRAANKNDCEQLVKTRSMKLVDYLPPWAGL